jgi:hypothetical protein
LSILVNGNGNESTKGPLSAGIAATDLQLYVGGVRRRAGSRAINHAVNLVGYVKNDNKIEGDNGDYVYIFKNSWGRDWGEDGFFRVSSHLEKYYDLYGPFFEGIWAVTTDLTFAREVEWV